MLFLCTLGGDDGKDLYYDFSSGKVYSVDRVRYTKEKGKPKLTSTHVLLLSGPCATLTALLFRGKQVGFDYITWILFLFFLIGSVLLVSFAISYGQKNLEMYTIKNNVGEFIDMRSLLRYFSYGTKSFRFGVCVFLMISLLMALGALIVFLCTFDLEAMFLIVLGVVLTTICLKILTPVQIIKFKLYLRRCKKECQKK